MSVHLIVAVVLASTAQQDGGMRLDTMPVDAPPPEPIVAVDRSVSRERVQQEHFIDRSSNLERVIDEQGNAVGRWRRERGCVSQRCADVVRDSETGEIAGFDGDLQGGFVRTGRGEEIVRFRLTPEAREALRAQREQRLQQDGEE